MLQFSKRLHKHPTYWTELAQSCFNPLRPPALYEFYQWDCRLSTSSKWMITALPLSIKWHGSPSYIEGLPCMSPIPFTGKPSAFPRLSPAVCHSAYTGYDSIYQMAIRLSGFVSAYQLSCWCRRSNRQLMQGVESQAERLRFITTLTQIFEKKKRTRQK